jgi:hypothetical protein
MARGQAGPRSHHAHGHWRGQRAAAHRDLDRFDRWSRISRFRAADAQIAVCAGCREQPLHSATRAPIAATSFRTFGRMSCRVRIIDSLRYLVPDLCTSAAEVERNQKFLAEWRSVTCIVTDRVQRASLAPIVGNLAIYTTLKGRWHFRLPGRWDSVSPSRYLVVDEGHGLRNRIAANQDVLPFAIFFEPALVDEVTRTVREDLRSPAEWRARDAVRTHVPRLRNLLRLIAFHAERGLEDESWYCEHLRMVLGIVLADGIWMPAAGEVCAREPAQNHRYFQRSRSPALRSDSRPFRVAHAEDELRRGSTSLAVLAEQMRIGDRLLLRWLVRYSSFTVDELRSLREHGRIPPAGADHESTSAAGFQDPLPSRRFSPE